MWWNLVSSSPAPAKTLSSSGLFSLATIHTHAIMALIVVLLLTSCPSLHRPDNNTRGGNELHELHELMREPKEEAAEGRSLSGALANPPLWDGRAVEVPHIRANEQR